MRKSYVGFTTNLVHRIRQHNREIKGGAKKTRTYYPWMVVCYVSGFTTKQEALKFEYMWQHPKYVLKSRYVMRGVKGRLGTVHRKLQEVERLLKIEGMEALTIHHTL